MKSPAFEVIFCLFDGFGYLLSNTQLLHNKLDEWNVKRVASFITESVRMLHFLM